MCFILVNGNLDSATSAYHKCILASEDFAFDILVEKFRISEMSHCEEYARFRIRNSPLASLFKTSTSESTKRLGAEVYKYLQYSIAFILTEAKLMNEDVDFDSLCNIICSETRTFEAAGLEYTKTYLKNIEDPYKSAEIT